MPSTSRVSSRIEALEVDGLQDRRICFIAPRFYPFSGGVEVFSYELTRRLVRMGYRVRVLTSDFESKPGRDRVEGVEVERYRIPFFLYRTPILPHIPIRLLLKDTDLIHIISTYPTLTDLSLITGRILSRPIVVTHQLDGEAEGWLGRKATWLYHRFVASPLIGLADRVVATSATYAESSPVISSSLQRVRVIPNAVDETAFNPKVDGSAVKARYGMGEGRNVLFVGRLVPYKGTRYLISAMRILRRDFPDIRLLLVGDGECREGLIRQVNDLGLRGVVRFAGHIPNSELPPYYACADVVVLPSVSRLEAFGIVLIEAMASGKPVVASSIPGVSEKIQEGFTGLLVPPRNPGALAEAVSQVLRDKKLASGMGGNARRLVEKEFTWEKVAVQYDQLYKELF